MCTKEEKDREYFDYVVEHTIVCNNLLGKKVMPLMFFIINNPKEFFNECIINDDKKVRYCFNPEQVGYIVLYYTAPASPVYLRTPACLVASGGSPSSSENVLKRSGPPPPEKVV
ncbi:hypothetical protein PFDG_05080 [Plasmodium falciparum Dd2]|uniref:Uncharacterized protein n=1 Tax=Plasmodium falciparum (isolate Dd2) TaxID=57267 RepID=A0A0L7M9N1_PLAF4|nr:hypothetical protein PFDG_05080 [Plasmodium falciparum Dd2]